LSDEIGNPSLTVGDCIDARHSVTAWCSSGCPGRDLDLRLLGHLRGARVVDLARAGRLVCQRCRAPASTVTVSAHLVRDPILRWQR
jgi:hypothetical protein